MDFLADGIEELRKTIADGTDADVALRVLNGFLDSWRNDVISTIETTPLTDEQLQVFATQLRATKKFRAMCNKRVEIAVKAREKVDKIGR